MHTGSNLGGHGLGDSGMTITTSLAHARSQSAVELQQAVAEANSLAAQAAEAQNRAQQAAQVCSHSPCICPHVFLSMCCPRTSSQQAQTSGALHAMYCASVLCIARHVVCSLVLPMGNVVPLNNTWRCLQAHAQAEAQAHTLAAQTDIQNATLQQAPSLASQMGPAASMQHSNLSSHPNAAQHQPQVVYVQLAVFGTSLARVLDCKWPDVRDPACRSTSQMMLHAPTHSVVARRRLWPATACRWTAAA